MHGGLSNNCSLIVEVTPSPAGEDKNICGRGARVSKQCGCQGPYASQPTRQHGLGGQSSGRIPTDNHRIDSDATIWEVG
jgi:hypothetical protein